MSNIVATLRTARADQGLTQQDIAVTMGTTQSAVARLEGSRVAPRLETVEAYAASVGRHLEVRGPDLTGVCVEAVKGCLDDGDHDGALRAVIQLFDDLLSSPDPAAALRAEADATGAAEWDATIAAACERVARLRSIDVPGWTAAPSRFLDRWWLPVEDILGRSAPGLACLALASSPPEFAVRGVLIDGDALTGV